MLPIHTYTRILKHVKIDTQIITTHLLQNVSLCGTVKCSTSTVPATKDRKMWDPNQFIL